MTQELELKDEHEVMTAVCYLEKQNQITLKGFKKIYREDGGCIHLAIYGIY